LPGKRRLLAEAGGRRNLETRSSPGQRAQDARQPFLVFLVLFVVKFTTKDTKDTKDKT
jgi:hypothetical protein